MRIIKKFTALISCMIVVLSLFSVNVSAARLPVPAKVKVVATSADKVKLKWSACSGVSGYRVYYKQNGSWKTAKDTEETSVIVSGLKASKTYTFAVRTVKKTSSKVSVSDSYTTAKAKTKGLSATKLTGAAYPDYVKLSWSKVSGASGYVVYRHDGSSWKKVSTVTRREAKVKELKGNKVYTFAVRAYTEGDGKAIQGPVSNYVKIRTYDPNKVTVKSKSVSDSAVRLEWTKAPSASGYRVYVHDGSWTKIATVTNPETLSCSIKNLTSDTEYKFRVRAYKKNSSGVTWFTPSDTFKVTTNPGAMDAFVYRIESIRDVFENEDYTFSYSINDDKYGKISATVSKNGDDYYLRTKVNERPYTLLNQADGSAYILLDENKSYLKVPSAVAPLFDLEKEMEGFIPSADWSESASVVTFESKKVICESFISPDKTKEIRFYFKAGKFLAIDEIGIRGLESRAYVKSLSDFSEDSLFDIPSDYSRIYFGVASDFDFLNRSLVA